MMPVRAALRSAPCSFDNFQGRSETLAQRQNVQCVSALKGGWEEETQRAERIPTASKAVTTPRTKAPVVNEATPSAFRATWAGSAEGSHSRSERFGGELGERGEGEKRGERAAELRTECSWGGFVPAPTLPDA